MRALEGSLSALAVLGVVLAITDEYVDAWRIYPWPFALTVAAVAGLLLVQSRRRNRRDR